MVRFERSNLNLDLSGEQCFKCWASEAIPTQIQGYQDLPGEVEVRLQEDKRAEEAKGLEVEGLR